jgi:hypothetical protein
MLRFWRNSRCGKGGTKSIRARAGTIVKERKLTVPIPATGRVPYTLGPAAKIGTVNKLSHSYQLRAPLIRIVMYTFVFTIANSLTDFF